jgi:hypothetical protein
MRPTQRAHVGKHPEDLLIEDRAMILRIPFVTEANFSDFKLLCEANSVGKNYRDYLRTLDETMEHAKLLQIETVLVRIDPSLFAKWLNGRAATRRDLLRYADMIHRNPLSQEEPQLPVRVDVIPKEIERRKSKRSAG